MSCKVKLSGFILFLDCQESKPDGEKWPDIRSEPDTSLKIFVDWTTIRQIAS